MQVTVRSSGALFRLRSQHLSPTNTAVFLSTTSNKNENPSTDDTKIKSFREELDSGPQLGEFIAGVVPRNSEAFADYSGKIKRAPGERERFAFVSLFVD